MQSRGVLCALLVVQAILPGLAQYSCTEVEVTISTGDCAGTYDGRTCASSQNEANDWAAGRALFMEAERATHDDCRAEYSKIDCERYGGTKKIPDMCWCDYEVFGVQCDGDSSCASNGDTRICCKMLKNYMKRYCANMNSGMLDDWADAEKTAGRCYDGDCGAAGVVSFSSMLIGTLSALALAFTQRA